MRLPTGILPVYAVKVIDKQAHKADILLRLRRESELIESLNHPNIVKLHEVIETQFSIYICMDYIEGTSLEQYLKIQEQGKLDEKEARRIIWELARAIAHCHSRFIVHRDLKPANVLITPGGKVVLIDFGLEIARGSNYTGPEVDIWCLGVVLYRMTVGRDPFVGSTKREVKYQIVQDSFQLPTALSAGLQQILRKLLSPDSGRRRSLTLLEGDPWLHEDNNEQFVSEDRGPESNRLSETSAWQLDKSQPRFHKSRIRIVSSPDAESDLLFQKDTDLSLLQFLMPILGACQVSYYLHSTTRILCGTSFLKDSGQYSQASVVLQKFVQHVGAVMTGASTESTKESLVRCGVFSVDIVSAKPGKGHQGQGRYLLIIKRLIGSSSMVQHFKKQFLLNATRDNRQLLQ
ncbi:Serine/threonine-protein kinase par-1 [Haplosporangium bisporale]|nr:Serine/threonine-protein kinase par-1 [Haplosporangium bisporale]